VPAHLLASRLRRLGLAFIVALLLQVRVDDRLVLLPLAGALVAWALWGLRPLAASPEADRAWRAAFASAVVATAAGAIGLIPAVEPGAVSVVAGICLLLGTISHCSLLALWSRRTGWADAERGFELARRWCTLNVGVSAVALAVLVALGDPAVAGRRGSITPGVVLGRVFEGAMVIVVLVAVSIAWIGAMVALQMANKKVRVGLADQPDAVVPLA
jgi:hypothetical protein